MSKNSLEFHGNQIEQLGHQMPGPDNSLIRLNSGSHQGVSKMSKDSLPEQQTLARSGTVLISSLVLRFRFDTLHALLNDSVLTGKYIFFGFFVLFPPV